MEVVLLAEVSRFGNDLRSRITGKTAMRLKIRNATEPGYWSVSN
jgi:hypothetical protein